LIFYTLYIFFRITFTHKHPSNMPFGSYYSRGTTTTTTTFTLNEATYSDSEDESEYDGDGGHVATSAINGGAVAQTVYRRGQGRTSTKTLKELIRRQKALNRTR
jgi:hypothetical protein